MIIIPYFGIFRKCSGATFCGRIGGMSYLDALILGVLQGITEFLPISSSGHLVLGEHWLGLSVESLKAFDVFVHVATLLAILIYFWKDVKELVYAFFRFVMGKLKQNDPYARLVLFIIIGTIPAVLVGLFGEEWIDGIFRNPRNVAAAMMIVGFVFLLGEYTYKRGGKKDNLKKMKWWQAVFIGVAQAVALIPGVSRSGSTIITGLFQGIDRSEAARFSFLLGIPAMAGAGLLTAMKIPENGGFDLGSDVVPILIGFVAALVFGLISVSFLMKFLKKHSLFVFAIYLIILGVSVFF